MKVTRVSIHLQLLGLLLIFYGFLLHCQAWPARHTFVVREAPYRRLCSTKNILTVNGQFPGPTLYAYKEHTISIKIINKASRNITLHWHGVAQPRNPWYDGADYITQCPIQPGAKFTQKIILSTEEGTLWWHAHSEWDRATVHGALIIYPSKKSHYPFLKPHAEIPIILGEWYKGDVHKLYTRTAKTGGDAKTSDAFLINGQPGDLYPCSKLETFKMTVEYGKTYLLRLINAAAQEILNFAIANHNVTVVGTDASYTKPFTTNYVTISPGQTMDILLHANQSPDHHYYMAAKGYVGGPYVPYDNTTTTALLLYKKGKHTPSSTPLLPYLPAHNETKASVHFGGSLRSLADASHPIDVPLKITNHLFFTLSVNTFACPSSSCAGPNGTRFASSVNNISYVSPNIDILQAYYYHIKGVYRTRFPNTPPLLFNFTSDDLPLYLQTPKRGTEVKVLKYNATVELVFQGTKLLAGDDHPMHLHGLRFYVVGMGLGNFDNDKDPLRYNLVDPPLQNTVIVPVNGWTAIRFRADNPGVWYMHCHLDRHMSWGMDMTFIVKNGKSPKAKILPPPSDMPPC